MNKILILPYNISKSINDLDYLSEGILEELNQLISTNSNLKTTSRSTSFYLLDNPIPPAEIKERYNIDFIIEGSVKFKDGTYQISTRLFKTANEELLLNNQSDINLEKWTQPLNGISNNTIAAINGKKANQEESSNENSIAKQLYLRGIYHWHRYSYEEMLLAIQLLKKSIKEDEHFALPYAALADCYSIIGMMGYEQPVQAFKLAKEFVTKSLLLNDKRSDSYVSAAFVDIYYNRDLSQAKINLEQALKLNRDNLKAHHVMAMYYIHKGDFLEAEKHSIITIKLDPLALPHFAMVIRIQLYLKRYQKAIDYINMAMNIDEKSAMVKAYRGYANLFLGNLESAIEDFKAVLEQQKESPMSMANLSYAYSKANFHQESRDLEQSIKQMDIKNDTGVIAYALAIVKLGQSDYNAFFNYSQKAIDIGIGVFPAELKSHPIYSEVREDSRFQKMLVQSNLSDEKSNFTQKRNPISSINITTNTSETLTIDPQDISFIQANDNYSTIYWHESGILKNKLLRITLKHLEQQLVVFKNIIRCHKTFMVNLNQELNITGNARGLFFEGKSLPIRIPISRLKNKIAAQLFESYHI
ncbi:MAG: LytTR family transcriptional regulator DNA-binding domain-containing protein [Flavobacteriales bacterium]|nr:LytTR family transcriptional regulator DNA-binding domain-containing protein [Flavobacteriales bacterium]